MSPDPFHVLYAYTKPHDSIPTYICKFEGEISPSGRLSSTAVLALYLSESGKRLSPVLAA